MVMTTPTMTRTTASWAESVEVDCAVTGQAAAVSVRHGDESGMIHESASAHERADPMSAQLCDNVRDWMRIEVAKYSAAAGSVHSRRAFPRVALVGMACAQNWLPQKNRCAERTAVLANHKKTRSIAERPLAALFDHFRSTLQIAERNANPGLAHRPDRKL